MSISPEFLTRYQSIYNENPESKVFAPLAEAYRKIGLLDEALKVCEKGVPLHPEFPGGHLILSKILIEKDQLKKAIDPLIRTTDLSPENILAHKLLAETYMKLRQPKKALSSYKMVLLLNPNDKTAAHHIHKLESLTADEYDDALFITRNSTSNETTNDPHEETKPNHQTTVEHFISLTDAFIVRSNFEKALETLSQLESTIGSHPEIDKRKAFLNAQNTSPLPIETEEDIIPLKIDLEQNKKKKIKRLQSMLRRIKERRINLSP